MEMCSRTTSSSKQSRGYNCRAVQRQPQEDAAKGVDKWRERERERGRGKVQDYRDPGQLVKEQARRWKELVSANEDRCREGLPPVMELPPYPSSDEDRSQVEHFALDGAHDL